MNDRFQAFKCRSISGKNLSQRSTINPSIPDSTWEDRRYGANGGAARIIEVAHNCVGIQNRNSQLGE
jgi:hypothetical protein